MHPYMKLEIDENVSELLLIRALVCLLAALRKCEERLAMSVEKHFNGYVGDKELLAEARIAIAKAANSR